MATDQAEEERALSTALRALSVNMQPGSPRQLNTPGELFCQVPESLCLSVPASPITSSSVVTPSPSPGGGPSSHTPSSSPITCSICLSPVKRDSSRRRSSISKVFSSASKFRTQCCGNVFHKDCLARHKAQVASSPGHNARACPLCRSMQPTGLTPSYRPPMQQQQSGGFVSGLSLHNEMVRRASSARNAVQRALVARQASGGAEGATPTPPPPSSVFFTSPGAAYSAMSAGNGHGALESRFESASADAPAADGGAPVGDAVEAATAVGVRAAASEVVGSEAAGSVPPVTLGSDVVMGVEDANVPGEAVELQ